MLSRGRGSGSVSDSGFCGQGWPPEVGLALGRHGDFSRSEGTAQVQIARFALGWQVDSWGVALGSPIWRALGTDPWGWKPETPTEA